MIDLTIVKHLGINPTNGKRQYVIEIADEPVSNGNPSIDTIKVVHDFVEFTGRSIAMMEQDAEGKFPFKSGSTTVRNTLSIGCSVQIGIREMIDIVLPYLNNHKYLQAEHLKDRTHTEDDAYFKQYDLREPRFKAGDKYPAYAYSPCIVEIDNRFYVRRKGQAHTEVMNWQMFNVVKDSLKLYTPIEEMENK